MRSLSRQIARQFRGLLAALFILPVLVANVSAQDEADDQVNGGSAPAASSKTEAKPTGGLLSRPQKSGSTARPASRPAKEKPYLEVYQLKSADTIEVA